MSKKNVMKCPECGVELRPEQVQAHVFYHWGNYIPNAETEKQALSRMAELISFMEANGIEAQRGEISL